MIFLKKIHGNMIFLQIPRKNRLSKKNRAGMPSFLYYLQRRGFFSGKYDIVNWTENERWSFSRNTWKYDIFCTYIWMLQIWYSTEKNTLKCDWHYRSHSRKSLIDSLYFYGDLHRRFHILLCSKKTQET